MAVRSVRRTVPGKRILTQPNQTTITAIGRTWNTQRSLLVQPEFASTGEFARFIPLDQIAARDRMLALTTSQVIDALRNF